MVCDAALPGQMIGLPHECRETGTRHQILVGGQMMSICDYHYGLLSYIILSGFPRVLDELMTKSKETHKISQEMVPMMEDLHKRIQDLENQDSI